jgi:hypothetical protein
MHFGELISWARDNTWLVWRWIGVSLALWCLSIVITVVAVRYYLIWIPPDHFARGHKPFDVWRTSHPAIRWTLLVLKNAIGVVLILAGVIMLVTPGPGWLGILIGLALVDLPGKRAVERRIVERPAILHLVNRIREKAGHPPLCFSVEQSPVV